MNLANLASVFLASARMHPERPALWCAGDLCSYAELESAGAAIARALLEFGGEAAGRTAIFAYRSSTAYGALLGALFAGRTYVPLNPRFPRERNTRMLNSADADSMIVDARCSEAAASLLLAREDPMLVILPHCDRVPEWALKTPHRFVCRGELELGGPPPTSRPVAEADPAYLLFTSGSTGTPKGIAITHGNACRYLESMDALLAPTPEDRFSQLFDLSFDLSVHDMFVCWGSGACLYCVPEAALIGPAEFVREHRLSIWFSVPSTAGFMAKLGQLKPGALPSLRHSLFCGEALPTSLADRWLESAPESSLFNLYGPTETTIAFTVSRHRRGTKDPGGHVSLGRPLPGQSIAIVDEHLLEVATGESGELCLSGSQLAPGYWNDSALTQQRFIALPDLIVPHAKNDTTWYRTGDRVRRDSDGEIHFLGRLDRQVQIRGYRVELGEIEAAVRRAAECELAAVIAWPRSPERGVSGTVAFVCGSSCTAAEIGDRCRDELPDYMVPGAIHLLDALPLNGNGKTDHRELERLATETPL